MKDGLLLFAAIGFALAELVRGQSFAGEYADKNYQNGGAAFHMSIEGSGEDQRQRRARVQVRGFMSQCRNGDYHAERR